MIGLLIGFKYAERNPTVGLLLHPFHLLSDCCQHEFVRTRNLIVVDFQSRMNTTPKNGVSGGVTGGIEFATKFVFFLLLNLTIWQRLTVVCSSSRELDR